MAPMLGSSPASEPPEAAIATPNTLYSEPHLRLDPDSPRSIRVLDLLPGPRPAPIRARLRVASLDAYPCPYYEALSYTWGPSTPTVSVTINDHYTLDITANAFMALESLRLRRATRTIWIDSICIDQKNYKEKDVQVPLMGDVYRSAAVVSVWLGRISSHPKLRTGIGNFFDPGLWSRAWREVRGDIKAPTIGGDDLVNAPEIKRLARAHAISEIRSDLRLFWHSLRGRHLALANAIKTNPPWHERLWIVQEYLLAKRLRFGFGHHWVSCDIAHLLRWARDDSEAVSLFKSAMGLNFEAVRLGLSWMPGARHTSLGGLQNILRTQQCFRSQDMVYGMLGLVDAYEAALITVNYQMDFWKVFAQATYAAIRSETTFRVLDMVDLRARRDDDWKPSNLEAWREVHGDTSELLPSWSIDFAHFPNQGGWQQGTWRGAVLAKRREQLQRCCSLSETCRRLRIKAVPFDKIVAHAPVETPSDEKDLHEDDVVYKLLFSVICPSLVAALRARELETSGDDHHGMSLLAAPLLSPHVKAHEVLELVGDAEMFSRRAHAFLSIAKPAAANLTNVSADQETGHTDQVINLRITGGNIVEPRHDPIVNVIKTVCLLWDSLSDTPIDMQRSGQVNVAIVDVQSFLDPCRALLMNATATSGGLAFFGTMAGGMAGIAPLGVDVGDLIVRAPDEESFLVLRQRGPGGGDGDGDGDGEGVVWQFMGRALIFSMHTPHSWERDELRGMVSFDEAPTFDLC
ncbi:Fc.00g073360.m01.CDS01 [Cosmosporella sp. VM-42]